MYLTLECYSKFSSWHCWFKTTHRLCYWCWSSFTWCNIIFQYSLVFYLFSSFLLLNESVYKWGIGFITWVRLSYIDILKKSSIWIQSYFCLKSLVLNCSFFCLFFYRQKTFSTWSNNTKENHWNYTSIIQKLMVVARFVILQFFWFFEKIQSKFVVISIIKS